ncbi:aspartate/glutamate racemase family protein [Lysobacter capsici]|uniref:aspartate/glutamate racemase family protein n=1 Tax=Lysobacter capsici TaxID=435897 RepID=UPI000BBB1A9C|nr:aspartate/glutamate racemase family protein [Lysobacter capsici]ATE69959.1 aspartate racemase [Lysobacter capsici]
MTATVTRTLGLLGGMSWESTLPYYRVINETVRERLGGLHSARLLLYSVDFAEVERLQHAGDWDAAGALLGRAARSLRDGGAELLVICTNTMHKVADAVETASGLPLLHIADPTGAAIRAAGLTKIGLLGTRFTMEQAFYRQRLIERHGLDVIVPDDDGRELVHKVIYEELCLGRIRDESREAYRRIIAELAARGAQGVILGCTEIGLLIGPTDVDVPLFDTTALHARAAALAAIG